MNIKGQFYDGVVGKPDLDEALEHYGIKGMKWRRRKQIISKKLKDSKMSKKVPKSKSSTKYKSEIEKRKYVTQKVAQDIADGKRRNTLNVWAPSTVVDGVWINRFDLEKEIKKIKDRQGRVGTSSHKF